MHVSEFLNGCLVVDSYFLHLKTHTHWSDFTSRIKEKSPIMPFFPSPVLVAESSAPPSLSDAPPSGVRPRLSDPSWAPPPPRRARPPAAAAAQSAHAQTPPPAPSSPDGVSPSALSWTLCRKQRISNDVFLWERAEWSTSKKVYNGLQTRLNKVISLSFKMWDLSQHEINLIYIVLRVDILFINPFRINKAELNW